MAYMKKGFIKFTAVIMSVMLICGSFVFAADDKKSNEDDHLKILFIGNSGMDDATDGSVPDSMLYKMMKSMIGDRKLTIGLGWSGGKSIAWHATTYENGGDILFFHADETSTWTYAGDFSHKEIFDYTDWDAVVLQAFGMELTGDASQSIEGVSPKFVKTSVSFPYMLDRIAENLPGARAYLYASPLWSNETAVTTAMDEMRVVAGYCQTLEAYKGTESSLGFTKLIPGATAVQAARSTYLATLEYNKELALGNGIISLEDDAQLGLQRDGAHLSFSVGRYLANLLVAETIIPENERVSGYVLPEMRESAAIGKLPYDYTKLVRLAVDAAHESAANAGKSKYVFRPITGYAENPLTVAEKAIAAADISVGGAKDKSELEALIAERVKEISGLDITVSVKVEGEYTLPAENETAAVKASVTFTHGYSGSKEMSVDITAKHKSDKIVPSFTDVAEGAWYYEGVMYAASNGYMKGTNAEMTVFSPDMQFTREQFVQLLFNMEGLDAADYSGDTGFTDVQSGQWYSAAVKWAKEAGVTSGIGDGKFGLGAKVTREQLAKFLMNYAEMCGEDTSARSDVSVFEDADKVSSWATDAVSFAVAEGLIGSTSSDVKLLSPDRVAIRSEIAKITMSYDAYAAK